LGPPPVRPYYTRMDGAPPDTTMRFR